jgi:hypothetical protein
VKAWVEILGGIGLAIAAEPIHEGGHAMATRLLTGAWPEVGLWAVHPMSAFGSKLDALIVLACGDLAVLAWWARSSCSFAVVPNGNGRWSGPV